VNSQETPAKPLEIPVAAVDPDNSLIGCLQNLSNYPARTGRGGRSTVMAINKRVRIVFYALATLELILLSAFYAWGRVAH
jgi:hypothetical protein